MKIFLFILAFILFVAGAISCLFNGEATCASVNYWPVTLLLGGYSTFSLA